MFQSVVIHVACPTPIKFALVVYVYHKREFDWPPEEEHSGTDCSYVGPFPPSIGHYPAHLRPARNDTACAARRRKMQRPGAGTGGGRAKAKAKARGLSGTAWQGAARHGHGMGSAARPGPTRHGTARDRNAALPCAVVGAARRRPARRAAAAAGGVRGSVRWHGTIATRRCAALGSLRYTGALL
jgi:hypothetical protein